MTGVRVLHWNIHSWVDDAGEPNAERVASLICRLMPDVVSLTEVDEPADGDGPLGAVAAACGYASVFCPAFEFGDPTQPRGAFGNAILTRLPVLAIRHRHLLWPVPSYEGSETSEARTATLVDLATSPGKITAITTHLPRNDRAAREAALARLADIAVTTGERWFIAGDFNTPPDWVRARELTAAPDQTPTYPVSSPCEPIDYIVTTAPLHATADVLHEPGSDHFPLLATIGTPQNP